MLSRRHTQRHRCVLCVCCSVPLLPLSRLTLCCWGCDCGCGLFASDHERPTEQDESHDCICQAQGRRGEQCPQEDQNAQDDTGEPASGEGHACTRVWVARSSLCVSPPSSPTLCSPPTHTPSQGIMDGDKGGAATADPEEQKVLGEIESWKNAYRSSFSELHKLKVHWQCFAHPPT